MKNIIVLAITLLIASPMAARAEPWDYDYRMWAAESMTNRLVKRLGRMTAACNNSQLRTYAPKISETCEKTVMGLYPQLAAIREVAASGDERQWAIVMSVIRRLEKDTEAPLQELERK